MSRIIGQTAIVNTTLARAFGKLDDAKGLEPGDHHVEATYLVRISADLKKLADTECTPTTSIPLITTLALLLEKSGITRESSARVLREALIEAIELGEEAGAHIADRIADVEDAVHRVRKEVLNKLPKVPKSGACKVTVQTLEIQEVSTESDSFQVA